MHPPFPFTHGPFTRQGSLLRGCLLYWSCIWMAWFQPNHAHGETSSLRASAVEVHITPSYLPVRMAGSMRPNQATAVHDPLKARLCVLDNGRVRLVLGTIDNCVIPRDIFDTIKTRASRITGIPTSHILLAATHTHSAPPLTGLFLNDAESEYIPELIQSVVNGVEEAVQQLEPARLGWTTIQNPKHGFNRRWYLKTEASYENPFGSTGDRVRMNPGYGNPDIKAPAGPTDPDVAILAAVRADGSPICLLANYSLHYVGGVGGLSGDYFGAFAKELSRRIRAIHPDRSFVGILSNGASGDINNLNYALQQAPARRAPYEQIKSVAHDMAASVFDAFQEMDWHETAILKIRQREIQLGVRKPQENEWDRINTLLEAAQDKDMSRWTTAEIYARESRLLQAFPDRVALLLQIVQIGEFGMFALPTETFVEIGLQLKQMSPFRHPLVIELANGYNGYLPTPEQHAWGGYETWRARSSYLETKASSIILEHFQDMLRDWQED